MDQEEIEAALGNNLATAIPGLLRLADLQVRIPRMEVVALEQVAARDGKTVSAVLGRELLDFVSTHSEWLSGVILGFAEALVWPGAAAGTSRGGAQGSPWPRRFATNSIGFLLRDARPLPREARDVSIVAALLPRGARDVSNRGSARAFRGTTSASRGTWRVDRGSVRAS